MLYTSIQDLQGLTAPVEYGAGVQDAPTLMARHPGAALQLGVWMVGALEGAARGEYDEQTDRLIAWLRGIDRPVFLRLGYECDLPANGYEPEAYVAAWRRIGGRLREARLPHVALVWHSHGGHASRPAADWYPGDGLVDLVAVSYFDPGQAPWLEKVVALAREHGKPLMIAEATPRLFGTRSGQQSWDYWFVPLFRFIEAHDVRVLCYSNWDWDQFAMFRGQGWEDARLQADATVLANWQQQMRQPRFVHGTEPLDP
jgi:hypothetical protein